MANVIAQNQIKVAINKQNSLKEEKVAKAKGGLRKDEDIKAVKISAGEDNSIDVLENGSLKILSTVFWDIMPFELDKNFHLSPLTKLRIV